jgi:hypothetical protein
MTFYKAHNTVFSWVLVISRTIKIATDLFFHTMFLKLFFYLLKQRQLKAKEEKITAFHKFLRFLIILLFCASLFHALLIFYSTFELLLDPNYQTSSFNKFFLFTVFIVLPVKDFFIALLFTYLYYKQGLKQQIQLFNDKLKSNENVFQMTTSVVVPTE